MKRLKSSNPEAEHPALLLTEHLIHEQKREKHRYDTSQYMCLIAAVTQDSVLSSQLIEDGVDACLLENFVD